MRKHVRGFVLLDVIMAVVLILILQYWPFSITCRFDLRKLTRAL